MTVRKAPLSFALLNLLGIASLFTAASAPAAEERRILAYDKVRFYSEELCAVARDNRWGFINETGRTVVKLQFYDATFFSEGRAAVMGESKTHLRRWGYIDHSGAFVLEPEWEEGGPFCEGMAAVAVKAQGQVKRGYINRAGKLIIPALWDKAGNFTNGIAVVGVGSNEKDIKYAVIDATGRVVSRPWDNAPEFVEGLALVLRAGKYGYIDKAGKQVIPLVWDYAAKFSEGLAVVGIRDKGVLKVGYIDKTGKVAINPQWQGGYDFHDGAAQIINSGNIGYIDKTGRVLREWASPPSVRFDFSGNLAPAKIGDKWGYINPTGNIAIEPQWESASMFSESLAIVTRKVADETRVEFIGSTGAFMFRTPPDTALPAKPELQGFHDGLALIVSSTDPKKFGLMNKAGEVILKPRWGYISPFRNDYAQISVTDALHGQQGLVRDTGQIVNDRDEDLEPPSGTTTTTTETPTTETPAK